MVAAAMASIIINGSPVIHVPSFNSNCLICPAKITKAMPFTKPKNTGCGTKRMNLPNLSTPNNICKNPAKITAANKYSVAWASVAPCSRTKAIKGATTTAIAPVAPEIIPGRPPAIEVTKPIVKAAYKPTSGLTPAIIAKATASGTSARATVKPDKISFFGFADAYLLISVNNIGFFSLFFSGVTLALASLVQRV